MNTKTKATPDKLTCAYCGAVKQEISFFIGAARKADWCMVEGTGKITCPACYDRAMADGRAAIDRHIAEYNAESTRIDAKLSEFAKERGIS